MTLSALTRLDRFARLGVLVVPLCVSVLPIEIVMHMTGIDFELLLGVADILDGLATDARASLGGASALRSRVGIWSLVEEITIG